MALPKAVQEAARRAEELSKQLAEQEKTGEVVEPEVEEVVEPDTNVDNQALEEEEDDETVEDEDGEDEGLDAEGTEVVEEDEEDDDIPKEETVAYWKQRFLTLQGKYNKEVPELWGKVRELEAKPVQKEPDEEDVKAVTKLNPEDFEDYGEEFITLVNAVNALEKRNKQLESLAQGFATQSQVANKSTFTARMTEVVPDWQEINLNPDFLTWLQQPEGYSGMSKHEAMLAAYNKFDAETVSKIFNDFKLAFKIPIEKNRKPKKSIKSEVTPSVNKTEKKIKAAQNKGRVWKRSDIAQFYKDKAAGKMDEAKAKKIEKDIFQANREGRIVNG
jgi:hypothetical protein